MEALAKPKPPPKLPDWQIEEAAEMNARERRKQLNKHDNIRVFAVEAEKPAWVSNYPPAPMDAELATGEPYPLLPVEPYPIDSALQHKYDTAEKNLLQRAGLIHDTPEFKLAFRTLRPSDRFKSLGQYVPYL